MPLSIPPTIISVSPNPVKQGGTLTFTGTGMSTGDHAVFELNGNPPEISVSQNSSGPTTVVITVPIALAVGTYNVFLTTGMGNGSNTVSVTVTAI
jgi:hypothetical protein